MDRRAPNRLRVAVSGATGLVGSNFSSRMTAEGHEVIRLVRRPPRSDRGEVYWNPVDGALAAEDLENLDAVVHLAGENIASGRWTRARQSRIRFSRVAGTTLLSETLAKLSDPPEVWVSASAIGIYGDRGAESLDESSPTGSGFLAGLGRAWEGATTAAERAGIRVVKLRIGVVLSREGGALAKMLPAFRLGLGGRLGNGRQFMSWIALGDLIDAIRFTIGESSLDGAVNATAPESVSNAEFTRTLGRVLRRPTVFPIPAAVLRLLFGEMADETLLASARVQPRRLREAGFRFRHRDLEQALRFTLGR